RPAAIVAATSPCRRGLLRLRCCWDPGHSLRGRHADHPGDVARRPRGDGASRLPLYFTRPTGGRGPPRRTWEFGGEPAFRLGAGEAEWRGPGDRAGLPGVSGGRRPCRPATVG